MSNSATSEAGWQGSYELVGTELPNRIALEAREIWLEPKQIMVIASYFDRLSCRAIAGVYLASLYAPSFIERLEAGFHTLIETCMESSVIKADSLDYPSVV